MSIPHYILIIATTMLTVSCASDDTIEDTIGVNNDLPMVFGTTFSQQETTALQQKNVTTRGAQRLQADFKVNTWKNFGTDKQQIVMNGYKVDYKAEATDNQWDYVGVFDQPQRYWDISAYPYEFRAVSPYIEGTQISENGIKVDLSGKPFTAQTYKNGIYNVMEDESEACLVAHVKRQKEGGVYTDYDVIKNKEINSDAKANAVREVHMPFHHLISKVGFRIFIDDPQPSSPDYRVTLKNVVISVVNDDNNFIIASKHYEAGNVQGLGHGTFTDNTKVNGEYVLLTHGEYVGHNLRENLNRETAFDLCPSAMLQIPQENVKIHLIIEMQTEHIVSGVVEETKTIEHDKLLSFDKTKMDGDSFSWAPDTRYVYYLHIPNIEAHDIFLDSCEILPWDEVQTSDIVVELE